MGDGFRMSYGEMSHLLLHIYVLDALPVCVDFCLLLVGYICLFFAASGFCILVYLMALLALYVTVVNKYYKLWT